MNVWIEIIELQGLHGHVGFVAQFQGRIREGKMGDYDSRVVYETSVSTERLSVTKSLKRKLQEHAAKVEHASQVFRL